MNKKITRIIAIVLVAVLLLGLLPLFANAETIQPRSLTQEDGVYYIESEADLKELDELSFSDTVVAVYQGEGEFVIEGGYLLEQVELWCENATLRVKKDASLDLGGLRCAGLISEGSLFSGWVEVSGVLEITGELALGEWITLDFDELDVEKYNRIWSYNIAPITFIGDSENVDKLLEVMDFAMNKANPTHQFRIIHKEFDATFTQSFRIPENCRVQVYSATIPAGVSITGPGELATVEQIRVFGNLEVENLGVFYYGGGFLTVEAGGTVSSKHITVDAYEPLDMAILADTLQGLDLSSYDVTDNEGKWELTYNIVDFSGYGTCGDGVKWVLDNDGTLTISGKGQMKFYHREGAPWYDKREYIRALVIEKGVTNIGDYALADCINLTDVTLFEGLTLIQENAFFGCEGLQRVSIPGSVTFIGRNSFQGCDTLTEFYVRMNSAAYSSRDGVLFNKEGTELLKVPEGMQGTYTVPDGVTTIGELAFFYCDELTGVSISDTVTAIGYYAFEGCVKLEDVTLGSSLTTIGEGAFAGCRSMKDVTLPGTVTQIRSSAFHGCESLTSMIIPDGITSIEIATFADCTGLTQVTIPDSVTFIDGTAFSGCVSLTAVTIPNAVTTIEDMAFRDCKSLTEVTIPASVSAIGQEAFEGCEALKRITFEGDALRRLGMDIFRDVNADVYYPADNDTWDRGYMYELGGTLTWYPYLPEGFQPEVMESGKCGTYVTWTLKTDGTLTISGKGDMKHYYNVDDVPWYDFRDEITSVIIEEGVTNIDDRAFYDCFCLNSITIPDSVKSIGQRSLGSCANLTEIRIGENNPNYTVWNASLFNKDMTELITVSGALSGTYFVPETVTAIGDYAFIGCRTLTGVKIPTSVTAMGISAFELCEGLTQVTIPSSIASIPDRAFYKCAALTQLDLEDGVTAIGSYAFYDCDELEKVTIPASVTSVGGYAFAECEFVREMYFEGDAPTFAERAFRNARGNIYYPENNPTWTEEVKDHCGRAYLEWIPYTPVNDPIPGDMNGDGTVDSSDVALLLWHTLFPDDYGISGDADFNADGNVDDADVAYLLWHTLFPEAYPL